MNLRQKIQVLILLALILFTFASYHEGTGSTMWLQWLSIVFLSVFMFIFDVAFTNNSQFIFDPDAENWRRKTVSGLFFAIGCCKRCVDLQFPLPMVLLLLYRKLH